MLCARWVLWLCTGSTWPSCFGKHFNWSIWASVSLTAVKTSCLPHFLLLRLLSAFCVPSWYAARCSPGLPHACSVWIHTVPLCRQKRFALGYEVVHDCSLHLWWLRRALQRLSSVEITAWCKPICSSKFVQLWGFFFARRCPCGSLSKGELGKFSSWKKINSLISPFQTQLLVASMRITGRFSKAS